MLLFHKRKKPVKKKSASYNLRKSINVCLENGRVTDLKCNINGLQRGEFIGTSSLSFEAGKGDVIVDSFLEQAEVDGKSVLLPVRLDEKRLAVSFTTKKPVHEGSYSVWSHVRLSVSDDYGKVKMLVFATGSKGLRKILGSSRSSTTILSAGATRDAWLPLICEVAEDDDWPAGGWQVVVKIAADAGPIYVDEPMLIKEHLWSQIRFEKF